jgi:hypothetical protein
MDPRFHAAQAALADGDVTRLAALFGADPELARARSQRSHPTLLQCLVLTMPPVDSLEELIDLLADHGAELTDPLIAAASGNNVRATTRLLDRGAQINGNGRWSPLEEALYWGNAACVSLLLERGAAVANLRTAAGLGQLPYIARCFDNTGGLTDAAGVVAWPWFNKPIAEPVRSDPEQVLANALVYAAAWGRGEAVDQLLDHGTPINLIPAGFDYAGTPLHYAALNGRRDTVDQLLRRGAEPAVRDTKIGTLPENWAAHGGHEELSEHLRLVRERAERAEPGPGTAGIALH